MSNFGTTEQFIQKAKAVHGDKYNYSKVLYKRSNEKVNIVCPQHGDFLISPNHHIKNKGCRACGYEKVRQDRTLPFHKFIKKAKKVHGNKYKYHEEYYKGSCSPSIITCLKHGQFTQNLNDHLAGYGCQKCKSEKISEACRYTTEEFIEKANQVHNGIYDYSLVEYKTSEDKVTIICNKHGVFQQLPGNHINQKQGCPACKASKGELLISYILEKNNIKFVREFRLPNYRFEYDFYLPDYNLLIEFHGIQHFKAIPFFGGEEALKSNQFRDMLKKDLAREYNIKLLEFNYKHLKLLSETEFETLILSRISQSKKKPPNGGDSNGRF